MAWLLRFVFVGCLGLCLLSVHSGLCLAEEHVEICRYCNSTLQLAAEDQGPARNYAPDRQVDVLHIKLDVTPNFDERTISGTTTIKFVPISQPLKELRLDGVDLTVTDVRSPHAIESFAASSEDVTIVFVEPIAVGSASEIEIDHSAEPTEGFYFRTPEMGYPETDTHVWTQGETHEARHWFPCFDHPNERSSTEVICHVPADMTVLSNGQLMSEELNEETQLKAVRWLQEKPHANYLICLVAGYLEKIEDQHRDVPLAFYTQPSLFEHAANSFVDTSSIMAYFEEEIGVPFPWNKYYQVTIRDFTAGGMENTTLTTLTHNTIFAKETENIRSTRSLDAHEMAHQWFGDYVTCKDWSHLWLNEGFATYYSNLYEGHKFGQDALLYQMYRDAKSRVLPQGKKDKRPIVYKEYKTPGEQFDYRSYPKGSWVLHMLRSQLGVDLYRECIKSYLEQHQLSSVVTEELNSVIEEKSGRSFDRFFDQWVYHAGHPQLKIDYRWQAADKLARVTVQQTQEVSDDVLLFQFPTKLRFTLDSGEVIDHEIEINKQRQDFYVALPAAPEIVRFDPEYTVLADVSFKKSDAMLKAQLENKSDIIGRLMAIEALADRKNHLAVASLKQALQADEFYGVRTAAARALRKQGTDEAFAALQESRDQADARVRLSIVESLGMFYRPEALKTLQEVVETEANPAIVSEAVSALGQYHGEEVQEVIGRSLRAESFGNEVANGAITAIGKQADASLCDELLQVLQERQADFSARRFGRALYTLAKISRDQEDTSAVREFLTGIVADAKSPVRASAIRALGALGDERSTALLESLSGDDRRDRIASAAKSALTAIQEKTQFVPAEVAEMRKLLMELKQSQQDLEKELERLKKVNQAKVGSGPDGEGGKRGDSHSDRPDHEGQPETADSDKVAADTAAASDESDESEVASDSQETPPDVDAAAESTQARPRRRPGGRRQRRSSSPPGESRTP